MVSLVLTKRAAMIEDDKSIHSQLRLITFSDGPPYETLHAVSKIMTLSNILHSRITLGNQRVNQRGKIRFIACVSKNYSMNTSTSLTLR